MKVQLRGTENHLQRSTLHLHLPSNTISVMNRHGRVTKSQKSQSGYMTRKMCFGRIFDKASWKYGESTRALKTEVGAHEFAVSVLRQFPSSALAY